MEIRLILVPINILLVPRCHVAELMLYSLFIKHFVHDAVCVFSFYVCYLGTLAGVAGSSLAG